MTDQFVDANKMVPITPPPELMEAWSRAVNYNEPTFAQVAIKAARWGADQELEACCEWFSEFYCMETWMQKDLEKFRAARRPKPPSLKEQATVALNDLVSGLIEYTEDQSDNAAIIRRALESLPS